MNDQGINSIDVFHGKGKSTVTKEFYADSAPLFANLIRKNLNAGKYSLVDLGGHKGELLGDVLSLLPEYEFDSFVIDRVPGLEEKTKATKIVRDITNTGFSDKSIDIAIMRYVLPWDAYDRQKLILKEAQRITKDFIIIQHQGAPSDNPKPLQNALIKLFGGSVPTLKREYGFFTESSQVEKWMSELGLKYKKIEEKYLQKLSDLFIEKFKLNSKESEATRQILGGCDGITVTTWLIRF